jgi:hypothetical protein
MSRLSFLVNMVRELPDPVRAVDYFNGERVFIDEMEKKYSTCSCNRSSP